MGKIAETKIIIPRGVDLLRKSQYNYRETKEVSR
jgi:hypothetical protein